MAPSITFHIGLVSWYFILHQMQSHETWYVEPCMPSWFMLPCIMHHEITIHTKRIKHTCCQQSYMLSHGHAAWNHATCSHTTRYCTAWWNATWNPATCYMVVCLIVTCYIKSCYTASSTRENNFTLPCCLILCQHEIMLHATWMVLCMQSWFMKHDTWSDLCYKAMLHEIILHVVMPQSPST